MLAAAVRETLENRLRTHLSSRNGPYANSVEKMFRARPFQAGGAFATVVLWSCIRIHEVALLSFSSTALGFLRCAIASWCSMPCCAARA